VTTTSVPAGGGRRDSRAGDCARPPLPLAAPPAGRETLLAEPRWGRQYAPTWTGRPRRSVGELLALRTVRSEPSNPATILGLCAAIERGGLAAAELRAARAQLRALAFGGGR
jgi:hypothetical protein